LHQTHHLQLLTHKMALIAKFSLNGNANDALWINNWTASNVTWVDWKQNQSASFNGTSSVITTWSIISTTTMSIWVWVNTAVSSATTYPFITKRNSNATWIFVFWYTSWLVSFRDYNWSAFWFNPSNRSTWTINNWKWRYVVFTRSWTTWIYYIDWVQSWTTTAASNITPNTNWLKIWRDSVDSVYYTWWLDEIEIYDHVLTPWEIKMKYLYYLWYM